MFSFFSKLSYLMQILFFSFFWKLVLINSISQPPNFSWVIIILHNSLHSFFGTDCQDITKLIYFAAGFRLPGKQKNQRRLVKVGIIVFL